MRPGDNHRRETRRSESRPPSRSIYRSLPRIVTRVLVDAATLVGSGLGGSAFMRPARIYVPNVQLREHRLRLNLTLEEVAEALTALAWERFAVRVGVNAGMVGKWERGEKRPSRFYQRLFVLLYGAPPEQLGFRPAGPGDQAAEDVLAELGASGGAARPRLPDSAAPGGARLPVPAVATPRRVDPEAVGRLGTILIEYAKLDNLLGPAHLLTLTKLHLQFISELLTVATGEGRAELLTVGARYAEFAGWLHQDAGNPQRGGLLVGPGGGLGRGR
jgi:transcriptional regulator with XRE-family HTH domain